MTPRGGNWSGGNRYQRAFDWFLSRTMRVLGAALIIYEMLVDKLHNSLALVVGGILATNPTKIVRSLMAIAEMEEEEQKQAPPPSQPPSQAGSEENDGR